MKTVKRIAVLVLVMTLLLTAGCAFGEMKQVETLKGGKLSRRTWVDESGFTVNGPDGYAYTAYTYPAGKMTEKYYTADDQPFRMPGGYYGRTLTYGVGNRVTEIVFLNENGKQTVTENGYSRIMLAYTSKGDLTFLNYYGKDDRAVINEELGYATLKNEYRGRVLTKTTFMDTKRNPIDTPAGYAMMTVSLSKKNNVTGIRYQHANGKPATCAEGWSSCEIKLDKKEREIARKYYAEDGTLLERGDGWAWEEREYESDTVWTVTRYDRGGKPVEHPEGYTKLRVEKDTEGRTVRESYLDGAGQKVTNTENVAATRFEYDRNGRLVRVTCEGTDGNPVRCRSGYAGYRDTFDDNGYLTSRVYLGTDGNPANRPEGWSEVRYTYDAAGELMQTAHFAADGSPVQ